MPKDSKTSTGAAYIVTKSDDTHDIYIDRSKINETSQLIGVMFEEVSHVLDGVAGRQDIEVVEGTLGEYGLESLGRATGEYFKNQYKENSEEISLNKDNIDYSEAEIGSIKVGDVALVDDATVVTVVFMVGVGYVVYQGSKAIIIYSTSEEAEIHTHNLINSIDGFYDTTTKKVKEVVDCIEEQGGRVFSKGSTKNERKSNGKAVEKAKENEKNLKSKPNKTPEDREAKKKAKKEKKKAIERTKKSENHSRRSKGQQNKGGGNRR